VGDFLTFVFWALVVWLVLVVAAVAVVTVTLRRSNRVVASVPGDAPVTWLVSPGRAARLHRRLRTLGTWIAHPAPASHHETWDELLDEMVAVDARIVRAARAGARVRADELDVLEGHVARLEDLAVRLRRVDTDQAWADASPPPPDRLEVLTNRVGTLEQAHADLARLDEELRRNVGGLGGPGGAAGTTGSHRRASDFPG